MKHSLRLSLIFLVHATVLESVSGFTLLKKESSKKQPTIPGPPTKWEEISTPIWRKGFNTFRMLDDLNPTAPFDQTGNPIEPSSVAGGWDAAQVFPAYTEPEVFPNDNLDDESAGNDGNTAYFYKKPVGVKYSQAGHTVSDYKVLPADATWPNGQVFYPKNVDQGRKDEGDTRTGKHVSGASPTVIVPPAERISWDELPIEANLDKLPKSSYMASGVQREDTLPKRYAKYMDQLADQKQSCENDTRQEHCVNKNCPLGQPYATVILGNTRLEDAEIQSRVDDDVFLVKVKLPNVDEEPSSDLDCSDLGCTVHQSCYRKKGVGPYESAGCSAIRMVNVFDEYMDLGYKTRCPNYHNACRTVLQQVAKGSVTFEGKVCV